MNADRYLEMNRVRRVIACIVILTVVLLFADAFDLLSRYGCSLNFDAWNVYALVAIFIITYIAIDSRDLVRKSNQEEVAKELLRLTYSEVQSYLNFMENGDVVQAVKSHIDYNDFLKNQKQYQNLSKVPFVLEDRIFEFAKDGVISATLIHDYADLKQKYEKYVTNRILFYDSKKVNEHIIDAVQDALNNANKNVGAKDLKRNR